MEEARDLDWGDFFRLYRPLAVRLARGIVREPASAEDVVQEAARAIVERVRGGSLVCASREHARNYFLRAVHNLAVSAIRVGARAREAGSVGEETATADTPGPLEVLVREEASVAGARAERALLDAIAGLRAEEREVLELRYRAGLGFREISARTGAPISTLHSRIKTALAKIRKRIGSASEEA